MNSKQRRSQIKQAELKPNPRLMMSGSVQPFGGSMNSEMAQVSLPLELGGRRSARIDVAEAQFKMREASLPTANGGLRRKFVQNSANRWHLLKN